MVARSCKNHRSAVLWVGCVRRALQALRCRFDEHQGHEDFRQSRLLEYAIVGESVLPLEYRY